MLQAVFSLCYVQSLAVLCAALVCLYYPRAFMYTYVCVRVCVYVRICIHVYERMYACMHAHVHVHVHEIHTNTHSKQEPDIK